MDQPKFILRPISDEEELANSDDMLGIYTDADMLVGFYRFDTDEMALPSAAKFDDIKQLIEEIAEQRFLRDLENMPS